MPARSVFAATADAGDGVGSALFEPDGDGGGEGGGEGDVEAAVAVEDRRDGAVTRGVFFAGEEEGDAGAVFAGVEEEVGGELVEGDGEVGLPEGGALVGGDVVAVEGAR